MNVLPVVIGDDSEERARKALAEAINEENTDDEAGVQLLRQHLEPLEWLEEEINQRGGFTIVLLMVEEIFLIRRGCRIRFVVVVGRERLCVGVLSVWAHV